jgi:2'-5' RNA ligase
VSVRHPPGEIERLASALEEAARGEGFAPERRPFRPHLTLARARRGERPTVPDGDSVGALGEVEAQEVVLFRSRLSPQGAAYDPIEIFPLAAGLGGA